jgi:hypothetical protein
MGRVVVTDQLWKKEQDFWDSAHHTPIWEKYDQVASAQDGTPKIMCRRCTKILEHPYSIGQKCTGSD